MVEFRLKIYVVENLPGIAVLILCCVMAFKMMETLYVYAEHHVNPLTPD